MEPSCFTFKLSPEQGEALRGRLELEGFEFGPLAYGHFVASKGNCKVAYYQSGKAVVQGKDAREWIEFSLEPHVLGEVRLGYEEVVNPEMFAPHFGIDESGKGDFFGPLVIAGAFSDGRLSRELLALGVKDSKRIGSDRRAIDLADAIKRALAGKWAVVTIGPSRYNELFKKFGNANRMLAWGHAKVIELLCQKVPGCTRALSDQFGNPALIERELAAKDIKILLQQRTKAESDVAVAAASILARAEFIGRLHRLSQDLGIALPKGAGPPVKLAAVEILARHGVGGLQSVCKAHFKTFEECLNEGLL